MMLRTPEGVIDVRRAQQLAAAQLHHCTDEIKIAVGLLATMIDELEAALRRNEELRETMVYRNNI